MRHQRCVFHGALLVFLATLVWHPLSSRATLTCDGVDDYAETAASASAFITATDGTISAWVKPTGGAAADNGDYVHYGQAILADANENWAFFRANNVTDQLWAMLYDGGGPQPVGSTFTNNTWIHLAWVHTGGTLSLYKDGVFVTSRSAGDAALADLIELCRSGGISQYFAGQVTAITFYNVALTAGELATLGTGRLLAPSLTRSPTAQWLVDECADGASGNNVVVVDRSGNGRSTTIHHGANTSGATCRASEALSYLWGAN